jgi:hypothetical protein
MINSKLIQNAISYSSNSTFFGRNNFPAVMGISVAEPGLIVT